MLLQSDSLQASIDEAYWECFATVSFDVLPDVEGAEALAPEVLADISEARFAELGRTHPKVLCCSELADVSTGMEQA